MSRYKIKKVDFTGGGYNGIGGMIMDVYYFFINAGSVLGSLLLCYLYRQESRSWKKTAAVYLISLAALLLGAYFGRLVRGLSYGRGESLRVLLTEEHGTHFIGRILFAVLFFP